MTASAQRVAVLGFGKIARDGHAPAWQWAEAAGRATVAAIYEPTASGCAAAAAAFPGAKVVRADARQAFVDAIAVDVIDVCTPGHLHHELVMDALSRGQHVLVEKPLAHARSEVEEMIIGQRGTVVQVCQTMRFATPSLQFKTALAAGALGRITKIQVVHHARHILSEAEWVTRSRGDGAIFENAIHFLDLAHHLVDATEPAVVDAARFHQTPHRTILTGFEMYGSDTASRRLSIDFLQDSLAHSALLSRVSVSATGADAELRFYPDGFRLLSGIIDPLHDLVADVRRLVALARRTLGRAAAPPAHQVLVSDLLDAVASGRTAVCPPSAVLPGVAMAEALSRRWAASTSADR